MKVIEYASDFVIDALDLVGGIVIEAVRLLLKLAVAVIIIAAAVIAIRLYTWDRTVFDGVDGVSHPYFMFVQAEPATVAEVEC